jgi:hypothetical protein
MLSTNSSISLVYDYELVNWKKKYVMMISIVVTTAGYNSSKVLHRLLILFFVSV